MKARIRVRVALNGVPGEWVDAEVGDGDDLTIVQTVSLDVVPVSPPYVKEPCTTCPDKESR